MKQEEKNDIAQRYNVNQLKPTGSKMTSQIQVNLNPQSINQKTHPEVAKTEEWVFPQWLG